MTELDRWRDTPGVAAVVPVVGDVEHRRWFMFYAAPGVEAPKSIDGLEVEVHRLDHWSPGLERWTARVTGSYTSIVCGTPYDDVATVWAEPGLSAVDILDRMLALYKAQERADGEWYAKGWDVAVLLVREITVSPGGDRPWHPRYNDVVVRRGGATFLGLNEEIPVERIIGNISKWALGKDGVQSIHDAVADDGRVYIVVEYTGDEAPSFAASYGGYRVEVRRVSGPILPQ